jgi:hypothetical protein
MSVPSRSDPSADPGNGVAGQGHQQVGPAHDISDKPVTPFTMR